jgi:maltooligosyltrehalose trehalohydrolase
MMPADTSTYSPRQYPVGAELSRSGQGAAFRVWAPRHERVSVAIESSQGYAGQEIDLIAEDGGYFSGEVPSALAGMRYRYRLGPGGMLFPDPASRFQPFGPDGPSEIINPRIFPWTDADWKGAELSGQVLYEMHIGTFTDAGTWQAAMQQLPHLAELGVTTLEVMPVAEFAGRFGWGYDGVDLYAPSHLYGCPDDFRRFVDRAHALRMGVVLDVVYNHLGPSGNYLKTFAPQYFSARYSSEWGDALNFDGDDAGPVREFVAANAAYWIDEFHLDGLRLDATQQICDSSAEHILSTIASRARAAAGERAILLIAENEPQDVKIVRPAAQAGLGLDALWNDDFHHTAMVALTGRREAYYTDYGGTPQELLSVVKWGFLYQGQRYAWQKKGRGTPTFGVEPARFVTFLQNHDQIANSLTGRGDRLHQLTSPGCCRAMTAFWLLAPGTPMLFQGQEFCASTPFVFFADHSGDLGSAVRKGRAEFMSQFRSLASRDLELALPDPTSEDTFRRCKLEVRERDEHQEALSLHRDLLRLRREDPAFSAQRPDGVDGAVLDAQTFVLRFFPDSAHHSQPSLRDRLVIVNLGIDLRLDSAPEPLLAPPAGTQWDLLWSSDDPRYGGAGTAPLETDGGWRIPGHATVVLAAQFR